MKYLGPRVVRCHFGVVQCTFLRLVCNSKMADCKVQWAGIWDSGTLETHTMCIYDKFDLFYCSYSFGIHSVHLFSKLAQGNIFV